MEHPIGRIYATNYLNFIEDELNAKGTEHNTPLYISVKYKDYFIGNVLIENDSTFNILPIPILKEMFVDESHIKYSTMMDRAYNDSLRQII